VASKKPEGPLSGKAFAVADLVGCRPMTPEDIKAACCGLALRRKSWLFKNIRKIPFFPVEGKLGLFEVDYNG